MPKKRVSLPAARFLLPALIAIGGVITAIAWIVSSPAGGSPDDIYHEASIWCPTPIGDHCQITGFINDDPDLPIVQVPAGIAQAACYAFHPDESAACLDVVSADAVGTTASIDNGGYPGGYYDIMHIFVSSAGLDAMVLAVRAANALIATLFFCAIAWLLPWSSKRLLVYTLLGFSIPLVLYVLTSVNPSAWGIIGVVAAWFALGGLFATKHEPYCQPWRRRALAGLAVAAAILAAMARSDCGTYCVVTVLAIGAAHLPDLKPSLWRSHRLTWVTMLAVTIIGGIGTFSGSQANNLLGMGDGPSGWSLLANNITHLPNLLIGFWTYNLGWFDVPMLPITVVPAMAVGLGLMFVGLRSISWPKALAAGGVALVLVVVPLVTLQLGGNVVGENVQPRYLVPLILMLAGILLNRPHDKGARPLSLAQTWVMYVFLVVAHSAALHELIRRYVVGVDGPALNLNRAVEWWRAGLPSPMVVWFLGSLGFALLSLLFFVIRRGGRQNRILGALDLGTEKNNGADGFGEPPLILLPGQIDPNQGDKHDNN